MANNVIIANKVGGLNQSLGLALELRELVDACRSNLPRRSLLHEYVVVYCLQGNHVQDGQL